MGIQKMFQNFTNARKKPFCNFVFPLFYERFLLKLFFVLVLLSNI